jgi:hypothetical protein
MISCEELKSALEKINNGYFQKTADGDIQVEVGWALIVFQPRLGSVIRLEGNKLEIESIPECVTVPLV